MTNDDDNPNNVFRSPFSDPPSFLASFALLSLSIVVFPSRLWRREIIRMSLNRRFLFSSLGICVAC
jgi:hypothetical protein